MRTAKRDEVRDYYGKLRSKRDLKTSACCSTDSLPQEQREVLAQIEDEILERFYGCGSPLPPLLDRCTVLDLGCGTGRDVYIASKLVGLEGHVTGVDMTEEQLAIARKYLDPQMRKFGFSQANVSFRHGYIEDLADAGIEDDSVDVVTSNCVINLSPDKETVFSEIFRVLKPGGELYFSDVFASRRVPPELRDDPVLYGECLGGAMYGEDFRRILRDVGFLDYRVVSSTRLTLDDDLRHKVGMVDFYSMTIRTFKLHNLEDICEDYGQTAMYLGRVPGHPHRFALDDHHEFLTSKPMLVCGNTAAMLHDTRYAHHFEVRGDRRVHFGAFDCAPAAQKTKDGEDGSGGACC